MFTIQPPLLCVNSYFFQMPSDTFVLQSLRYRVRQIHPALPDPATPPSSRAPHSMMSGRLRKKILRDKQFPQDSMIPASLEPPG